MADLDYEDDVRVTDEMRATLADCLRDWGFPGEADNVAAGIDLDSYETSFRLMRKLEDFGLLDYSRTTARAQGGDAVLPPDDGETLRLLELRDDALCRAAAELIRRIAYPGDRRRPSVEQEWARLDGTTAYHLIQRHAENWFDAGRMMDAWRLARAAALSTPQPDAVQLLREISADTTWRSNDNSLWPRIQAAVRAAGGLSAQGAAGAGEDTTDRKEARG